MTKITIWAYNSTVKSGRGVFLDMPEAVLQDPLTPGPGESPATRRRRRRKRPRSSSRASASTHRRLRLLYFALATVWGFVMGTAAVLGGLAFLGQPVRLEPVIGAILLGAGGVAVVGGLVAAMAYRDVIRRFR